MQSLRILGFLGSGLLAALQPTSGEAHNCQCRNRGVMFELGETSCLRVDGRNYLARCEMKLNVSSWTELQDGCPVTMGPDQSPARLVN